MKFPKRVRNYVVIYDISSDRKARWASHSEYRRAKIARLLLEFGIRTQKSVFELTIPSSKMEKIAGIVSKIANHSKDKIYIYPMESKLLDKVIRKGKEVYILKSIFI